MKNKKQRKQIDWVCNDCGSKYGRWYQPGGLFPETHFATYHMNTCDVCNTKDVAVTEPRDFGYLVKLPESELQNRKET